MDNQKNLYLAVVFSIAVLFGFDFFFGTTQNVPQENFNDNQTSSNNKSPTLTDSETFSIKITFFDKTKQ